MGSMTDTDELDKILEKCFSEEVKVKYTVYKSLFLPVTYLSLVDGIENFEVRDDDVWVCSFPKAGTTWTQEMVYLIVNDLDFEGAKAPQEERFPFLEYMGGTMVGYMALTNPNEERKRTYAKRDLEYISKLPSPRLIKTHLPFHLLPRQLRNREKKCKIVYVARNPKDVCVSYFHHYQILETYHDTFENYCKLFLGDKVHHAPFWTNVIGFWQLKDDPNVLFLKYEDMKADLPAVLHKTASFFGKKLSEDQVEKLMGHLSFETMKNNPSVNREKNIQAIKRLKLYGENYDPKGKFMRKGQVGDWKTYMSPQLIEQFDEWTKKELKDYEDLRKEFP